MISIYNDDFTTPKGRDPYFIEVYRCVTVSTPKVISECGDDKYPVPHTWTDITIVVPGLGTKPKFYKYVIYNHTSCKCEDRTSNGQLPDRKLRKEPVEKLGECLKSIQILAVLCINDDGTGGMET